MGCVSALIWLFLFPLVGSELFECPLGWEEFEGNCYHFVFYPTRIYEEARPACQADGAILLSANSKQEHEFVSTWLTRHDGNRNNKWWTSGIGSDQDLSWEGDGTSLLQDQEYWISAQDRNKASQHIVYRYSTESTSFAWGRESAETSLPYICEISVNEAYRIVQAMRDHTYGTNVTDINKVERGPRFTIVPNDLVIVGSTSSAYIECESSGQPHSSYHWMRKKDREWVKVTSTTSSRYTLTNGKLTFGNPKRNEDAGEYQCVASNKKGSILSHPIQVSFGYLYEFSNDPPGAVRAPLYQGTVIGCNPPGFNPAVRFQWFKDTPYTFVRPSLNHYLFISHNGKLYFSETQQSDAGDYHCIVSLTGNLGQTVATSQPPSRTSLGIRLIITGDTANDFGPVIHNDFPAVFPSPTLRSHDIRLECFAYGRLPLHYSWSREGSRMPGNAQYKDRNRVVIIPEVSLEDSGNYTCHVRRGSAGAHHKSFYLDVQAEPYFIFPLRDQHVDVGSELSWRCEVMAKPRATYAWYRNGTLLTSSTGDMEVEGNLLVIHSARSRHSGMYQCAASNRFGTSFSSAELRVLEFAPTFVKRPVSASQVGTIGGNTTIICQPEAAPKPEIMWKKDGRDLGLTTGSSGHYQLLANGNLLISDVTIKDEGKYECQAANILGTAKSGGTLKVVDKTTLSIVPTNEKVVQNNTAFLFCQASFDRRSHDLVYVWMFNDKIIDTSNDPHYAKGLHEITPGLYVKNAEYKHAGLYTCMAQTVQDKASHSAYLDVLGPPGEPAGVFARINRHSAHLTWTLGTTHGSDITSFTIEFRTDYRPEWRIYMENLPNVESIDEEHNDRRFAQLHGLSPGSSYNFRVRAVNNFGIGTPSVPSPLYKIPSSAPLVAPQNVGGGGGSVATLVITWDPLSGEDHNGEGLGYRVYYRRKTSVVNGRWQQDVVEGRNGRFVTTVGTENYFLEYEAMVAAFNTLGQGPNSTITIVLSAEDLPTVAPINVQGESYNGTAIMVYWDLVPNTRQAVKGRVLGYQINYYQEGVFDPILNAISHYGQVDSGLVIGLEPDADYWVNMQVFNTAGLGPRGEEYRVSTYTSAPLLYPRFVEVHSESADSVHVSWQGVSTGRQEETLLGYKLRYWEASENLLTAKDVVTNDKETYGIIRGIQKGIIYKLRVLGYNWGGDGVKSPPVFFTLEGQVRYDPTTSEIRASGSRTFPSQILTAVCALVSVQSLIFALLGG